MLMTKIVQIKFNKIYVLIEIVFLKMALNNIQVQIVNKVL